MNRTYTYRLDPDSVYLEKGVQVALPMSMTLNGTKYAMTLKYSEENSAV